MDKAMLQARRGSAASDTIMLDGSDVGLMAAGAAAASADAATGTQQQGGRLAAAAHAHPSAYMAPAQVRAQAEPDHYRNRGGDERGRGDLTADNLAGIPEADQVAPGIRLETMGSEFRVQSNAGGDGHRHDHGTGQSGQEFDIDATPNRRASTESMGKDDISERVDKHRAEMHRSMHVDAPSSIGVSGRSSTGAIDNDEGIQDDDFQGDGEDVVVHERVGGSGATAENASKGTSVGHFGPRGEAIPGVPPHLDPRQPHFRPPSPSAASVFSVAVQPPASPKMQASSASTTIVEASDTGEDGSAGAAGFIDSGDETESFENGVVTPTRSDDEDADNVHSVGADSTEEDQLKSLPGSYNDALDRDPSTATSAPYGLQRLSLDQSGPAGSMSSTSQVSFNPVVTSHRGSVSSFDRAPSIAATAGSSRAPSTRGLSPPASASRAGTSSSIEEFGSSGTGLIDAGNETPSVGRSRRSSYSAPSSEAADGMNGGGSMQGGADDINNRARGATLVPGARRGSNVLSYANVDGDEEEEGEEVRSSITDGPSLAPSEAGSDSTRSVTNESSTGHGASTGGYPSWMVGGGSGAGERLPSMWATQSPVVLEPGSGAGAALVDSSMGGAPGGSSSSFKSPLSAPPPPTLPNLLSIKKAARRQGSGAASTAGATTGTASPPSSLSVDGDIDEAYSGGDGSERS